MNFPKHLRIIPRLDIKAPNLVKGVRLEGFRVMGDPTVFAERYSDDGADELHYQDVVASLYRRNNIYDLVSKTASELSIPLAVGGGIREVDDIRLALRHGADRVIVNTAAIEDPSLITRAATVFGTQCVVVAIEAVTNRHGKREALVNCGRDQTGIDPVTWAVEAVQMGAGELLLTSVDNEGMRKGMDLDLLSDIRREVSVPLVLHGGAWSVDDIQAAWASGASGVALASCLHYGQLSITEIKNELVKRGVPVRI